MVQMAADGGREGGAWHDPKERSPAAAADSIALADWLAANGHPAVALVVYLRQLRDDPVGELATEALLEAGFVQLHALSSQWPPAGTRW